VGKPELSSNIKMHPKEVKLEGMVWIRLAQDKNRILKNMVISHQGLAIRVLF
jgi:hypothetical protein